MRPGSRRRDVRGLEAKLAELVTKVLVARAARHDEEAKGAATGKGRLGPLSIAQPFFSQSVESLRHEGQPLDEPPRERKGEIGPALARARRGG